MIYLAAVDSTCGLEGDLGALTSVLKQHAGGIDQDGTTISYCTEILLDGPVSETDLAIRIGDDDHDSQLTLTEFTRERAG